jgi:hypothetical protein
MDPEEVSKLKRSVRRHILRLTVALDHLGSPHDERSIPLLALKAASRSAIVAGFPVTSHNITLAHLMDGYARARERKREDATCVSGS